MCCRNWRAASPNWQGSSFWSDEGFYNVVGNLNGREFMAHPKIVTLGE